MRTKIITIYDLYDQQGKVMETLSRIQAEKWKRKGEKKLIRGKYKSAWYRARKMKVRSK